MAAKGAMEVFAGMLLFGAFWTPGAKVKSILISLGRKTPPIDEKS